MKKNIRYVFIALCAILFSSLNAFAQQRQGSPFFRNFTAQEYGAHERNFDVECDNNGNVYFANFQGVLHYNGAEWKLFTTPEIVRITSIKLDGTGGLYIGAYNTIGKLVVANDGRLEYKSYKGLYKIENEKIGEVLQIYEKGDNIFYVAENAIIRANKDSILNLTRVNKIVSSFIFNDEIIYQNSNYDFYKLTAKSSEPIEIAGFNRQIYCTLNIGEKTLLGTQFGLKLFNGDKISDVNNAGMASTQPVYDIKKLSDGTFILSVLAQGLVHLDKNLKIIATFSDDKGLASNSMKALDVAEDGTVYCASANGISAVSMPSYFSRYSEKEGLLGEVLTILRTENELYVGTYEGVFIYDFEHRKFNQIKGLPFACWNLVQISDSRIFALSGSGIYQILKKSELKKYSDDFAINMLETENKELIVSLSDGIYKIKSLEPFVKEKLINISQVNNMFNVKGKYWFQNVYGEIFYMDSEDKRTLELDSDKGLKYKNGNNLYSFNNEVYIVGRDGILVFNNSKDRLEKREIINTPKELGDGWLTHIAIIDENRYAAVSGENRLLIYESNGELNKELTSKLSAMEGHKVRYIKKDKGEAFWLAGSFGLIKVDFAHKDNLYERPLKINIRSVKTNDSILWRGNSQMLLDYSLSSNSRYFSTTYAAVGEDNYNQMRYSYKLKHFDDEWSEWGSEQISEYKKLPFGHFTFMVKAKNSFGQESEIQKFDFSIAKPFYIEWYSIVFYVLVWFALMYLIFKWRMRSVEQEKLKLERMVQERTAEVRSALKDLGEAQDELVRQEKMAMVGKLTKGLVDRILNPINYINNFAMLSSGFLKDIMEVVEDVKEHIPEDDYEDLVDVKGLMGDNLSKISQHGQSVSRILKTMEEMLRDRKNVFTKLDLVELCKISLEQMKSTNADLVSKLNISVLLETNESVLTIDAISDLLSKSLNSLLVNSMYALNKKAEKEVYSPELKIVLERDGDNAIIKVYDNGIGIESTIIKDLFDPYFTTKPTSEAAGIGLYMTKDVIQSHGGIIEVCSEKNLYTEFIITLPINHNIESNEK